MSAQYQIYVDDPKEKTREWAWAAGGEYAKAKEDAAALQPQLPDGLKATAEWGVRPEGMKAFDPARLVEKPRDWAEEEEG